MKLNAAALSVYCGLAVAIPPGNSAAGTSGTGPLSEWRMFLESFPQSLKSVADTLHRSTVDATVSTTQQIRDGALEALNRLDRPRHPKHPKHGTEPPVLSIYQTLQSLEGAASEFTKLLDGFPELIDSLNSTEVEHTLFLPIDAAFDKIPDKFKHPSKEALEKFLRYHLVAGTKSARDVVTSYTLESEAHESHLGGENQRIRVGASLAGVTLNGYAKIKAVDIKATNGVIHTINSVLAPPPPVGLILTFFPSYFSTLLLAYERTDFVKFVHGQHLVGSTVFAPSNKAFEKLGAKANAFLFNTKVGVKYLDAILKYGIVPNATLYSDEFYDKRSNSNSAHQSEHEEHYTLETFLPGASLGVDIAEYLGFRFINVNGFTGVSFHDAIGSNGVLHVVDKVILPPHRGGKHSDVSEISVEALKERLRPYMTRDALEDEEQPIWGEL